MLVKGLSERERSQSRRPLRELRHVMAQRSGKRVRHRGAKHVCFLYLGIPRRLRRIGIKGWIDRVEIGRLHSVIQLVTAEHIVVVTQFLVYAEAQNVFGGQCGWNGYISRRAGSGIRRIPRAQFSGCAKQIAGISGET